MLTTASYKYPPWVDALSNVVPLRHWEKKKSTTLCFQLETHSNYESLVLQQTQEEKTNIQVSTYRNVRTEAVSRAGLPPSQSNFFLRETKQNENKPCEIQNTLRPLELQPATLTIHSEIQTCNRKHKTYETLINSLQDK